jgi:hypothetical protein
LKKEAKTFYSFSTVVLKPPLAQKSKSFLVLFFKKEPLDFLSPEQRP